MNPARRSFCGKPQLHSVRKDDFCVLVSICRRQNLEGELVHCMEKSKTGKAAKRWTGRNLQLVILLLQLLEADLVRLFAFSLKIHFTIIQECEMGKHTLSAGVSEVQKRASTPLELKLQAGTCELPEVGTRELNSGPPEKQYVLVTMEPTL